MSDRFSDPQYVEYLLMQWGINSLGDLGMGYGKWRSDGVSVGCTEKEIALIDRAVSQIGLSDRRLKLILKYKYLSPETEDRTAIFKGNGLVASKFNISEGYLEKILSNAFSDLGKIMKDLLNAGGSVERRWFR